MKKTSVILLAFLLSTLQTLKSQTWSTIANKPTPTEASASAVIGSTIYVVGGSNKCEAYNTLTNTWSIKANVNVGRGELVAAAVNGKIYAIGGFNGSAQNICEEYDPSNNTWTIKAPMPTTRSVISAAVINNKIYVVGGWPGNYGTLEVYDPATNTWATKSSCPNGRLQINSCSVLNNKFYFIGGPYYAGVDVYDPNTNTWSIVSNLPSPRFSGAACLLDNEIHYLGGVNGGVYTPSFPNERTHYVYNSVTNTWRTELAIPQKRSRHISESVNGKIYVIGGFDSTISLTNTSYVFTPSCIANITNNDTTICKGSNLLLSADTAAGNTYLWSTGAIATTSTITVSPTVTTKYYCTVKNGTSTCKDSVMVTVSTIATNIIAADTVKVCGTTTVISAIAGLSSYAWSNGATTQSTSVTSSGWYKCTATNGACAKTDSVYVSLFNPKITQNDTTVCAGTSLTLNVGNNLSSPLTGSLRTGLVGWWPFNGNANDESGNASHGTNYNASLIPDRFGVSNKAMNFNGTSSYIEVRDTATLRLTQASFSFWIAYTNTAKMEIFQKINFFTAQNFNYSGELNDYANLLSGMRAIGGYGGSCNSLATLTSQFNANNGAWHHLVFVMANNKIVLYLDGVKKDSIITNGSMSACPGGNLYIGRGWNDYPLWLQAKLDDFGIYNRALSTSEIQQLYSGASSYLWSNGATTPSINVNPITTTSYIVTINNGINTCKDTVKVTVNTLPANIITVDTVKVCGTSTSITASAGFVSYSWSNGATTQATTVSSSGWYKCTVTNAAGCTARDSVYVSLFNPKILQNDTTVCAGNGLVLQIGESVNDIDGNKYDAVAIGNQMWMNKNLDVSRYSNGDTIPQLIESTNWLNTRNGAWCYPINSISNRIPYGKLYNWYALNDIRNITPSGWRVSTANDWLTMINFLGGESIAGGKIKEAGTSHFTSPNLGATNSSGFTALPAGVRMGHILESNPGSFYGKSIDGVYWTSTSVDSNNAIVRAVTAFVQSCFPMDNPKTRGASVRCLRSNLQTYLWSTAATTPSITVNPTATTSYIVTVSNGIQSCKDTVKISIHATPATPAAIQKQFTPTSIPAVTNVSGLVSETYRIRKVANAVSYDWSLKRGTLASITHLNPLGVNDTAVTVTFNPCFLRDTLCVKSVGVCSSSVAKTLILYSNTTPANIAGITTPGGNFASCIGTTKTFTAYPATPTATQTTIGRYRWTLPSNVTLVSANTDSSSITVQINTGFVGGNISVRGVNACTGTLGSALSTPLQHLPPTPLGISSSIGSFNACVNNTNTYTAMVPAPTASQAMATVFRWTRPAFTTILSASFDSSSITVRFNTGFTGGALSVRGQTICGTLGTARSVILTSTGCRPAMVRTNADQIQQAKQQPLDAQLYPNPSVGSFNLKINTSSSSPIIVKVMNTKGQLMKSFIAKANVVSNIGNELNPGVYMIAIRQGEEEKVLKAVKQ